MMKGLTFTRPTLTVLFLVFVVCQWLNRPITFPFQIFSNLPFLISLRKLKCIYWSDFFIKKTEASNTGFCGPQSGVPITNATKNLHNIKKFILPLFIPTYIFASFILFIWV
jgi:hypothetical protein